MGKVLAGITISVDGFITGPGDGPGCGLGVGGERLHYWVFGGPWSYDSPGRGEPAGEDKAWLEETMGANGAVPGARTRIEPNFDPDMVRQLKSATEHDMTVGVRTWPGRPSRPGWSTSCSCSWLPSSSEAASERSPTVSARISNYWTRSRLQAVLSTSGTAPRQRDHLAGCRRPIGAPGLATQPWANLASRRAHAALRVPAQITQIGIAGDDAVRSTLARP